tara:strand:+ start:193 stop:759 length:567 start_codon:yes stop_codon:yes gene_type:complete
MRKIYQFIDIETTHLNPEIGEIIEIAILTSYDGGRTITEKWTTRIKPEHIATADPRALEINKYCPFVWHDAPNWVYAWAIIIEKINKDAVIVAHNILFDAEWINSKIGNETDWKLPRNKICTKSLAIEHLPSAPSTSLSYLRKLFGLSHILAHTAAKDALDCHVVFNKLKRATTLKRLLWKYKIWRLK